MTLIEKYNRPFQGLVSSLLNDNMHSIPVFEHSLNSLPKVNLLEDINGFNIQLAAPGLNKKDFKIDLNNRVLTISVNLENNEKQNFIKKEFNYNSFTRSFNLPEIVKLEKINASYNEGILNIEIPKKDEAKPIPPKTIKIS